MQLTAYGKARRHELALITKLLLMFKLTAVFVLLTCLQAGARALAQGITLSEESAPMEKVLKEIRKQSGLTIWYEDALLQKSKPVDIHIRNGNLDTVLAHIFRDQPLSYEIINHSILAIREREAETSPKAVSPPFVVHGKVLGEEGEPLAGVSVSVKGSRQGTVTNAKGEFALSGLDSLATLVLTGANTETKEIKLEGRTTLVIRLKNKVQQISEVAITVSNGYQEISKENFTGTAVTISGEDLKKVDPQNVLRSLQSFDPSFKIVENNLAGSNPNALPNINVRGSTALPSGSGTDVISRNTLSSGVNLPTFILDGYEVSLEQVYDLDINRIKSITLLKDAAATAVYGSRAANGVVVITTNPPKNGKLQVSYNYELNTTTPDLTQYHVLDASQKLAYENMAGLYNANNNGALSQDQLNDVYYHKLGMILSGVNTYWLSQPLQTTFGQKHSVYVEGGSGPFRVGLAARYETSPGVMKGSGRDRYSTDLTLSYNLGSKFLFRNDISATQMNSVASPYGDFSNYARMNPYYPKYDSTGHIAQVVDTYVDRSGGGVTTNYELNPMYDATLKSFNKDQYFQFVDAFSADWTIMQGLRLRGQISVNRTSGSSDQFISPMANEYYFYSSTQLNEKGSYTYGDSVTTVADGNMTLNYNHKLGGHFLNVLVGANFRTSLTDTKSFSATGFTNDQFPDIGFAYGYATGSTPNSYVDKERLFGTFASANYSYKDKYLMDLTFREDGSSQFGSNNRIAPFSAVGIGWNMHKEDFMKGSPFSRLKIRASTGLTGSVSFAPYMAQTTYSYYTGSWYSTGAGAIVSNYGNQNLQWQKTRDYDLGMEIGLLQDRILIMPRYYYKLTTGLVSSVSLPPSTGFSSYLDNVGNMRNTGEELNLQVNVIRNRNFNLSLTANLTHNRNVIVKISDALKAYNERVDSAQTNSANMGAPLLRYQEGQSLDAIYAVRSLGIDPETGNEIFVKKNGTLTYNWSVNDIVPAGNTESKVEGFFGTNVRYKQFNLLLNFYTRLGGQLYNQTLVDRVENADPHYNVDYRVLSQRWEKPGDRVFFKNVADLGQTQVSSRFIQRDNVLALNSFYLSYDAGHGFSSKLGMRGLRFAFTTNDLFWWGSVKQERGIDYPYARSFTTSILANF